MNKKGNSVIITRGGILLVIVISSIIAWMAPYLPIADGIIAKFTSMFFALTSAAFLPIYFGALYVKKMPKAAAIGGMVSGAIAWFIWTFFINADASYLKICELLTGKTSLVIGTSIESWKTLGTTVIALPISILVTIILTIVFKMDMDKKHLDNCFKGIN